MSQSLEKENTKFQVRIKGRVLAEASSRQAADIIVSQLSENEQAQVEIVAVVGSNQVLLG